MATGTTGTAAWVVIVIDDLYNRMAAAQADALKTAALAVSQTESSVFDAVMPDVAARIRQYVASNPLNRLSETENSVPPELKWCAVWLTLQEMMARLAIALELTEDQKAEIRQANADLKMLLDVPPLRVSRPDDPEADPALTAGPYAEVVNYTERKMTRTTLQGL